MNLTSILKLATAAALAPCLLFAATTQAAETPTADGSEIDKRFAAADKDSDGKLTPDEAKNGMPRISRNFSRVDTEGKGYLTLEQIKAMRKEP